MAGRTLFFANHFIDESIGKVNQEFVPHFHLSAPIGWINDPNGFSHFNGKTHMFCQYYPYDATWGPMHWGHWATEDLIHWEWINIAIAPDEPYDNMGCFSGTAIDDGDRMILMYTGVHMNDAGEMVQEQCIAESTDGVNFTKWDCNPVLRSCDLPEGSNMKDFRDPKLQKTEDGYRVVVANRDDEKGRLLVFTSKDLKTWKYDTTLLNNVGTMAECPDYGKVDGKDILIHCAMNKPMEGYRYQNNHHAVLYALGEEDHGVLNPETIESIDLGPDFYAPEMCQLPDGRVIMIGWMHMWGEMSPTDYLGHRWCGEYTCPRELHVKDGKLLQMPVAEIAAKYVGKPFTVETVEVNELMEVEGLKGRRFDMEMDVELPEDGTFELRLFGNVHPRKRAPSDTYFSIRYDVREKAFHTDRSRLCYSMGAYGGPEDKPGGDADWHGNAQKFHLRVLVDSSSVELFMDEGELAMSTLAFPVGRADKIFFNGNCTVKNLVKHEIM